MSDLIPFILSEEMKRIANEIESKPFSIFSMVQAGLGGH